MFYKGGDRISVLEGGSCRSPTPCPPPHQGRGAFVASQRRAAQTDGPSLEKCSAHGSPPGFAQR
eukprot:15461183-Alexandrium_andersonii.AAC.1